VELDCENIIKALKGKRGNPSTMGRGNHRDPSITFYLTVSYNILVETATKSPTCSYKGLSSDTSVRSCAWISQRSFRRLVQAEEAENENTCSMCINTMSS
jgi:hypothetical protein